MSFSFSISQIDVITTWWRSCGRLMINQQTKWNWTKRNETNDTNNDKKRQCLMPISIPHTAHTQNPIAPTFTNFIDEISMQSYTHRPYSVIKSIIAFIMRYIRCDHKNRNVNHFGSVKMPHLQPKQTAHAFLRIYWISARSFRRISWQYFFDCLLCCVLI